MGVLKAVEDGIGKAGAFLRDVGHDFLAGMGWAQEHILPLAVVAVDCVPGTPPIVSQVVKALPGIMTTVEQAFPDAGQGQIKKAAVMGAVKAVCDEAGALGATGASDAFARWEPMISQVIDASIAATKGTPAPAAAVAESAGPGGGA